MSFIANTAFEARITNNDNDNLANVAGKFGSFSGETFTAADCSAGLFVVPHSKLPCEGFSGVKNENAYYMTLAGTATTANDVVYACNTYDNQLLANGNNAYFMGKKTLGLGVPAGRYGNFTEIKFDNRSVYRVGAGNIASTIGTNTYFTIADTGLLTPTNAAPASAAALYFTLEGTGKFVEGTGESFGYVDVKAHKVIA